MNQISNIFLKDVRRFWREGSASIALLCALGWNEVRGWTYRDDFAFASTGLFSYRFLTGMVSVLVPVAWAFLIVRVVQGESLVGDRQFWLTRPYEWKKLLTAKLVFFFTFINLPLLILDLFLLSKAGFTPTRYAIGLLWMQLMIVLFLILPATALAAVTASIIQTLLALLIIALYMVGMATLAEYVPSSSFSGPADSLSAFLLIGICLAVILLQYSRRTTVASRLLISGFGGALLLLLVATPYRTIVARWYLLPTFPNSHRAHLIATRHNHLGHSTLIYLGSSATAVFPDAPHGCPILTRFWLGWGFDSGVAIRTLD
jgi:hypothetical protein